MVKEQEVERNPLCFCLLKLSRKEGVVHLRMVQPKGFFFFEPQLDGRLVGTVALDIFVCLLWRRGHYCQAIMLFRVL